MEEKTKAKLDTVLEESRHFSRINEEKKKLITIIEKFANHRNGPAAAEAWQHPLLSVNAFVVFRQFGADG